MYIYKKILGFDRENVTIETEISKSRGGCWFKYFMIYHDRHKLTISAELATDQTQMLSAKLSEHETNIEVEQPITVTASDVKLVINLKWKEANLRG